MTKTRSLCGIVAMFAAFAAFTASASAFFEPTGKNTSAKPTVLKSGEFKDGEATATCVASTMVGNWPYQRLRSVFPVYEQEFAVSWDLRTAFSSWGTCKGKEAGTEVAVKITNCNLGLLQKENGDFHPQAFVETIEKNECHIEIPVLSCTLSLPGAPEATSPNGDLKEAAVENNTTKTLKVKLNIKEQLTINKSGALCPASTKTGSLIGFEAEAPESQVK